MGDGDGLKASSRRFPALLSAVREGRLGGAEMAAAMAPDQNFRFLGLVIRSLPTKCGGFRSR
jgi:hypothetical protein